MLDPEWAITRPLLWLALVAVVGMFVLRAVHRDRREYARFKRYRSTRRRQAMYRTWLLDSFVTFGSTAAILVALAGAFIAPLLAVTSGWTPVAVVRGWVAANPVLAVVVGLGAVAALVGFTIVGAAAARQEGEVRAIGDINALLPRNRSELGLGALLAANAGILEELVFRLGLPTLLFGATGSAIAAVLGSIVLFGALHVYQGVAGVVATTLVGAIFMASYLLSGTILVPIVLHIAFDLRTMVMIPMAVNGVHRVPPAPPA